MQRTLRRHKDGTEDILLSVIVVMRMRRRSLVLGGFPHREKSFSQRFAIVLLSSLFFLFSSADLLKKSGEKRKKPERRSSSRRVFFTPRLQPAPGFFDFILALEIFWRGKKAKVVWRGRGFTTAAGAPGLTDLNDVLLFFSFYSAVIFFVNLPKYFRLSVEAFQNGKEREAFKTTGNSRFPSTFLYLALSCCCCYYYFYCLHSHMLHVAQYIYRNKRSICSHFMTVCSENKLH